MTRPTTGQRGYGYVHKRERAQWKPKVERGEVPCAKCGRAIQPDEPWDLGHTPDRTAWTGPEHANCNRSDGATRGNQKRRSGTPHHTPSRDW